jgi:hypothetical protein
VVRVAFLNPEGLINNASWLRDLLGRHEGDLEIRAYDRSGREWDEDITPAMLAFDKENPTKFESFLRGG